MCQSLFFKRLWDSCVPVNFAKFLSTQFLWNTLVVDAQVSSSKVQRRLVVFYCSRQLEFKEDSVCRIIKTKIQAVKYVDQTLINSDRTKQ